MLGSLMTPSAIHATIGWKRQLSMAPVCALQSTRPSQSGASFMLLITKPHIATGADLSIAEYLPAGGSISASRKITPMLRTDSYSPCQISIPLGRYLFAACSSLTNLYGCQHAAFITLRSRLRHPELRTSSSYPIRLPPLI